MSARLLLSLPEWTVLTLLSERPAHGFAIAQLTEADGELGRIWRIPRPIIYRAIGRLAEVGLVTPDTVEPGRGPQRTIYAVTPRGREAAARWLEEPVEHIRDVRSHLLLKLALIERAGHDPTDLVERQKSALEPIARAIEAEHPVRNDFDATLFAWRKNTVAATMTFLDDLTRRDRPGPDCAHPDCAQPSHASCSAGDRIPGGMSRE